MNEGISPVKINSLDIVSIIRTQTKPSQIDQAQGSLRRPIQAPDEVILSPYAQYLRQMYRPESPEDINRETLGRKRLVH